MEEKSESKIKMSTTTKIRKGYFFFLRAIQALLIAGAFFLLVWQFIARPMGIKSEVTMLPTLGDESEIITFNSISPQRGDIVLFRTTTTNSGVTVSRVIGVSGDKIVLKDGYVFLNGKLLDEPYTLRPRSTFVSSLAVLGMNCQEIMVPNNKFFVLQDNRTVSGYSIYHGFVSGEDITGVIPKNWVRILRIWPFNLTSTLRDTSHDKDLMGKSVLDVNKYVDMVNQKRIENGILPLKYDKKVELSSNLRLQNMVKYNDFSFEATKSGYTREKSFNDAGFNSGIINEEIAQGAYDSGSLFDDYWFTGGKDNLLNKNFQYIGIASETVDVNNCPNQVIVQHFWGK